MPWDKVVRLDWPGGDCLLGMLTSVRSLRFPPPQVSLHVHLRIDGFHRDGRWVPLQSAVCVPVHRSLARSLVTPEATREVILHRLSTGHLGRRLRRRWLPDVALRRVSEELSRYVSGIAGMLNQRQGLQVVARVRADARVRVFVGEEEEEEEEEESGHDEDDLEEELDDADVEVCYWAGMEMGEHDLPPLPTPPPETGAPEEGQHAPEQEEEAEEEKGEGEICAICLGRMAAAAPWAGQQLEGCWLPCSHSFHGRCLHRWLRQKPECPLCRMQVAVASPPPPPPPGGHC